MNIFARIKRDVNLRNPTIYAQWFVFPASVLQDDEAHNKTTKTLINRIGILSSLAYGLTSLLDLVLCINWLRSYVRDKYIVYHTLPVVLRALDLLIFVPGPLILESPSLCVSIGWVFQLYVGLQIVTIALWLTWDTYYLGVESVWIVFALMVGFGYPTLHATVYVLSNVGESTSSLFRLPARFSIYLLLWIVMFTSCVRALRWGWYGVFFFIPPTLAATAVGLYGLAWRSGHKLVHSRLLGGSGIEPMPEGLFGSESESGPVGPGQIRL